MLLPAHFYVSPEWLALREAALRRDGNRCRNCGAGDPLDVHHWLPEAPEVETVDEFGYGFGDNPLLVPLSGLVSLCRRCHDALTQTRRPEGRALAWAGPLPGTENERRNVFQLWCEHDRKLPLKVVKETWTQAPGHYFLVEKVEIGRWPYGFAWGRYCRAGKVGEFEKLRNAGTYTWQPYQGDD